MKPCRRNRKNIALMALQELKAVQRTVLVAHLEECKGCQRYFEEISGIAATLANAGTREEVQASGVFHQTLIAKLRSEEKRSLLSTFVEQWCWGYLKSRVLYMSGVVAVAVIGILALLPPANIPPKKLETRRIAPGLASGNSIEPTISNYEMVANLAPERLDQFLTEQGSKGLAPMPIYRASTLPLEIGAD